MACSVKGLLGELGVIDKEVKKGRYTERQHDKKSANAISKCLNRSTTKQPILKVQKYNWNFKKTKLMDKM